MGRYKESYESRVGMYGLDSSGSGQEPVVGYCKYGNEPSGSKIKVGNFLTS
jgi:hypothetical protein